MSRNPYAAPGEFPLGSPQSRAAARMRLEQLKAARPQFELMHSIPRPRQDNNVVHEGEWSEMSDGQLRRLTYVPQGSEEIN